jgi:hypothetical protein
MNAPPPAGDAHASRIDAEVADEFADESREESDVVDPRRSGSDAPRPSAQLSRAVGVHRSEPVRVSDGVVVRQRRLLLAVAPAACRLTADRRVLDTWGNHAGCTSGRGLRSRAERPRRERPGPGPCGQGRSTRLRRSDRPASAGCNIQWQGTSADAKDRRRTSWELEVYGSVAAADRENGAGPDLPGLSIESV